LNRWVKDFARTDQNSIWILKAWSEKGKKLKLKMKFGKLGFWEKTNLGLLKEVWETSLLSLCWNDDTSLFHESEVNVTLSLFSFSPLYFTFFPNFAIFLDFLLYYTIIIIKGWDSFFILLDEGVRFGAQQNKINSKKDKLSIPTIKVV
jgi:hypothetical protein